jgi:hypothetical protein
LTHCAESITEFGTKLEEMKEALLQFDVSMSQKADRFVITQLQHTTSDLYAKKADLLALTQTISDRMSQQDGKLRENTEHIERVE